MREYASSNKQLFDAPDHAEPPPRRKMKIGLRSPKNMFPQAWRSKAPNGSKNRSPTMPAPTNGSTKEVDGTTRAEK